MKNYFVLLMYCFLFSIVQAQETKTIVVTGEPSTEDDYYVAHLDKAYSPADHTFHQIAKGKGKQRKTPQRQQSAKTVATAEQALPLDEENTGSDFNEFNA